MSQDNKIETLTLDGQKLFEFGSLGKKGGIKAQICEDIKDWFEKNDPEAVVQDNDIQFFLNLDDKNCYGNVVKARIRRDESAFYFQLKQVVLEKRKEDASIRLTDIIYIDFSSVDINKKENAAKMESLFSKGLILKPKRKAETGKEEKEEDYYCRLEPFDRSASMARKSVITFIDKTLKAKMDERLTLGIFQNKDEEYHLSKVFSYRGLYLSSGTRIEPDDFQLDEKSVVVIPDRVDSSSNKSIKVYTKTTSDNQYCEKTLNDKKESGSDDDSFKVNCYDGEGLISFEAAERLAELLAEAGLRNAKNATSFQIRLPLCKGVLHAVDFQGFLKEEFHIETDAEDSFILDCYGIPRQIKDIQIVLNESMFKAHKWIKSIFEGNEGEKLREGYKTVYIEKIKKNGKVIEKEICDPMKYYFDKFKEYKHALYVLRTDQSLHNNGHVMLNYQFLNTGMLKNADFISLLKGSFEETKIVLDNDNEVRNELISNGVLQSINIKTDAEEGTEDIQEVAEYPENRKSYASLLKRYPEVAQDEYFDDLVEGRKWAEFLMQMRGNLRVNGENRFLSGDLLYFLRDLAHRCVFSSEKRKKPFVLAKIPGRVKYEPVEDKFYKHLMEQKLREKFYAPEGKDGRIVWGKDKYYAVLRNPHLSRNEQWAMRAYIPSDLENNLYYKYFHHLTGVIMLPYASPVAERLSGADFDGDIVKLIDNDIFNASAKECVDKKLPLVLIPHESEVPQRIGDYISYDNVKNGFGSRVGRISNLAVRCGETEYNENLPEDDERKRKLKQENFAAQCCILVGQEIDRAKTGKEPDLANILKIGKEYESEFLKKKDKVGKIKFSNPDFQEKAGQKTYTYSDKYSNIMTIQSPSEMAPNLETLMFHVLENRYGTETANEKKGADKAREHERPEYTGIKKEDVDEGLKRTTKLIILAYLQAVAEIRKEIRDANTAKQIYKKSNYKGRVYYILQNQYDRLDKNPIDGQLKSVKARVACVYRLIEELHSINPTAVEALKNSIVDEDWQYTPREKRKEKIRDYFNESIFRYENDKNETKPEYLSNGYKEDLEEAVILLSDFRCRGYNLLYYILKDVIGSKTDKAVFKGKDKELCEENMRMSVAEELFNEAFSQYKNQLQMENSKEESFAKEGCEKSISVENQIKIILTRCLTSKKIETLRKIKNRASLSDDKIREQLTAILTDLLVKYERYHEEYIKIYINNTTDKRNLDEDGKLVAKEWEAYIATKCREDLRKAFKDKKISWNDAVGYWYECKSSDSKHRFLWHIFTADEIKKNISKSKGDITQMLNEIREYEQCTKLPGVKMLEELKGYYKPLDDKETLDDKTEADHENFVKKYHKYFRLNYSNLTKNHAGIDRALTIIARKFLFEDNFAGTNDPNEYYNTHFNAAKELLEAWLGYDHTRSDEVLTEKGKNLYKKVENYFPSYILYLLAWTLDKEIEKYAFNITLKDKIKKLKDEIKEFDKPENYANSKEKIKKLEEKKKKKEEELKDKEEKLKDKKKRYNILRPVFVDAIDKIIEVLRSKKPSVGRCDLDSAISCCKELYDKITKKNTGEDTAEKKADEGLVEKNIHENVIGDKIQRLNNVLIKIRRDKNKYMKPVFTEEIGSNTKNDAKISTFRSIIAAALDLGKLKNKVMYSKKPSDEKKHLCDLRDRIIKYSEQKGTYGKASDYQKDSILRMIGAYLIVMEQNAREIPDNKKTATAKDENPKEKNTTYACTAKTDIANWCWGDSDLETKELEQFYYDSDEKCRIIEDTQVVGDNSFKFKINPSLIEEYKLSLKEDDGKMEFFLKPDEVIYVYRDAGSGEPFKVIRRGKKRRGN